MLYKELRRRRLDLLSYFLTPNPTYHTNSPAIQYVQMSSFSAMFFIVALALINVASSTSLRPVARDSPLEDCKVEPAKIKCGGTCKEMIVVDPTEDDYGPILTKALKKAGKDKCTLYLSAGTYPVKTTIRMRSDGCLQGAGRFLTKIVARNSGKDTKNDGILRIDSEENISISGISIDSTKCKQKKFCKYIIKIKDSFDIKLFYSAFDGALTDGSTYSSHYLIYCILSCTY